MIKRFLPVNKGEEKASNITHEMIVEKMNELIGWVNRTQLSIDAMNVNMDVQQAVIDLLKLIQNKQV